MDRYDGTEPVLPTVPPLNFPSANTILFFVGGLLMVGGSLLRVLARWLAWPERVTYSGERAQTPWAFAEALFIDFGILGMVFGFVLILMGLWRVLR